MEGFWDNRFDELAEFNADKDKSKYNSGYLQRMEWLQSEYNDKMRRAAKEKGWMVII